MFSIIIMLAVAVLFAGLVFGLLLQLATKIVLKEPIEFGDAFKTAFIASLTMILVRFGLELSLGNDFNFTIAFVVAAYVIWVLALMIIIGLKLGRSLLIALVFMVISEVIFLVFTVFLEIGRNATTSDG